MIYVDDPMWIGGKFDGYCHCWTDGERSELDEFVRGIGLSRDYRQDKNPRFYHYDLSVGKRALALLNGARYMKLKDWIGKMKAV